MRRVAIRFLRQTARGPLVDALPSDATDRSAIAVLQGKLFRFVGRAVGLVLSPQRKAAIQEYLINRYRIPVSWQPRLELREKLKQGLERLQALGEPLGDYVEFGVYQGNSMICMHRATSSLELDDMRLFGFDSFEGLPESAKLDTVWSPGQFRADIDFTHELLTEAGIDWSRTQLVQGFYDEVLDAELAAELGIDRISMVMIDCDLYTSTREALDFCAPLLGDHCVILFDDWESTDNRHGEKRAFGEFLQKHAEFEVEDLGGYHDHARVVLLQRNPRPAPPDQGRES